jgi:ABC-2 type transport system ATP-binding protein
MVKGFSGGELQRLGIAQALVSDPKLLILDEPAASLDPIGRNDVLGILEKLRGQITVFYSTHILSDVQRVSDTVGVMHRGKLIAQAPIDELLGKTGEEYLIRFSKDADIIRAALAQQDWIKDIVELSVNEPYNVVSQGIR